MARKPLIEVEKLSKVYRLGRRARTIQELVQKMRRGSSEQDLLWSLNDVSFNVGEGEILGIIGRNGAGKSTLLKILSRITEPTRGRAIVRGKVASLLEIGTGFHPDLTGRENVFLNGSLLGMRRDEIKRKFDSIVDFSEVERFIDTPVKHYSSGMYIRLAFSVAAHLEADILLVDEVLAVGDYSFQQKCLQKTEALAGSGRTVLFVSHNLGVITRLCASSIYLEGGRIRAMGPSRDVVHQYVTTQVSERSEIVSMTDTTKPLQIRSVRVHGAADDRCRSDVAYDEGFSIRVDYEIREPISGVSIGLNLGSFDGTAIFASSDLDSNPERFGIRRPGKYHTEVKIPGRWLNTGRYLLQVHATHAMDHSVFDTADALTFNIVDTDTPGSFQGIKKRLGVLQPVLDWHLEGAP